MRTFFFDMCRFAFNKISIKYMSKTSAAHTTACGHVSAFLHAMESRCPSEWKKREPP